MKDIAWINVLGEKKKVLIIMIQKAAICRHLIQFAKSEEFSNM